ncbi:basic proline-rich protein-like isoform X1 [Canis lupus familiaris]|uniref:basic proline-rich protein-like isoform X1 n=1 Tax=Canis lupus familiaris TaxID=9615 RepID=UPI0018F7D36F|nr:basic proline-rich protein-like isoform X1 [Canis lupus familiaris]
MQSKRGGVSLIKDTPLPKYHMDSPPGLLRSRVLAEQEGGWSGSAGSPQLASPTTLASAPERSAGEAPGTEAPRGSLSPWETRGQADPAQPSAAQRSPAQPSAAQRSAARPEAPSPAHASPTTPCSGGTLPARTRAPLPGGPRGHLRRPPSPRRQLLPLTPRTRPTPRRPGWSPGSTSSHARAPSPPPRRRVPPAPGSLPAAPLARLHTSAPPQRLQPRGPARAWRGGEDTPAPRTPHPPPAAAAPHVCPGPGAPAVTGADGSLRERGLRRTPPELRSVCCSPPPERGGAEVPSRLSGPSGSRSPGRCPPAPLPPEGRSGGGGGSPGLTSSLLSTSAPGFPAPTPALGLSPPLPPPSSQPRARLPSAPPPPSARRPSRPPLTSAAGLRVGAGRREEEKGKLSGHVPDPKPSASPFLRRFDALRLHSWRGPRPHAQTAATHTQRLAADRPPGHRSEISRQAMLDVKNDPGCRRRKVFLDGSWKALCPSKPVSDTEME